MPFFVFFLEMGCAFLENKMIWGFAQMHNYELYFDPIGLEIEASQMMFDYYYLFLKTQESGKAQWYLGVI